MLDAVVLAPDDVDALTAHALEEARVGELARAFQSLRRAEALAPWNPGVFVTRAAVLARLGDCQEALDAVQRAMDVLPDEAPRAALAPLLQERARIQGTCRPAHLP
jgi:Flp pilus assembly protein TadD